MSNQKFRAWDTNKKKMWSAEEMGRDQLTLSPDGRGFVNVSGTSTKLSQYLPHLIPLQFIRRDMYDKEIYDGDIVSPHGLEMLWEVQSDEGAWKIASLPDNSENEPRERWLIGDFLLDVVGNIHENPELLTKGKETL